MCNFLHLDSKPIPEEGIGWKLFTKCGKTNEKIILHSLFWNIKYNCDNQGVVKWDTKHENNDDGFCFFLDKKIAIEARDLWTCGYINSIIVEQICYKQGLGKHIELCFIHNWAGEIAICKEFSCQEFKDLSVNETNKTKEKKYDDNEG